MGNNYQPSKDVLFIVTLAWSALLIFAAGVVGLVQFSDVVRAIQAGSATRLEHALGMGVIYFAALTLPFNIPYGIYILALCFKPTDKARDYLSSM